MQHPPLVTLVRFCCSTYGIGHACPTWSLGSGLLNCIRLSILGLREVVHQLIYTLRHRACLVCVLHGWVGMQTASRCAPASDPALASYLHAMPPCPCA